MAELVEENEKANRCACDAKRCCRKTVAFLFSHIGLTALVVGYSIMGAFLFQHLEQEHEQKMSSEIRTWKHRATGDIWNITTELELQEAFQNNCTSKCTPPLNDPKPTGPFLKLETAHLQPLKEKTILDLWNITMDLNVLWKENWTLLAEKEMDNFVEQMQQHIQNQAMHAKEIAKPATTCTTLCTVSADVTNQTKENWGKMVTERLETFQDDITAAAREGFASGKITSKWTFSSSFLYALSVITTIGYGHVTPKTTEGRVVTVAYAVVGIPIMLMFLANVGDLLAKIFRGMFAYLCRCRYGDSSIDEPIIKPGRNSTFSSKRRTFNHRRSTSQKRRLRDTTKTVSNEPLTPNARSWESETEVTNQTEKKEKSNVPVLGCLVIMSCYLFGGATLFALWEGWQFLDAFYFCFVTLTTIGFGDFVPGASWLSNDTSNQKLVMCCLYVLVGLALIACCFNLMQHQVRSYVRAIARFVGLVRERSLEPKEVVIRTEPVLIV